MRVVIVGATGNVGTSLVRALGEEEQITSLIGLARREPGWSPANVEWRAVDVRTDELAGHFSDADVVVHLAWMIQPTHQPMVTWQANVEGSRRVLEAVERAGVPALVYASSIGAYSPGPKDKVHAVDESWPTDGWPPAAYTREKAYVERILDAFECRNPDIRVVRMRTAFIFKRESAASQRRLFVGPFLPSPLLRGSLVPFVPDFEGLATQALHADDAAEAYRLAILREVHGAFNVAADPVLDAAKLAELVEARTVRIPRTLVRLAVAIAWHARLTPASPRLFDAACRLPLIDTTRAREELGWSPRHSSTEAATELVEGLRTESGMDTPPLAPSWRHRLLRVRATP